MAAHSYHGWFTDKDGQVVTFFTDHFGTEEEWELRMAGIYLDDPQEPEPVPFRLHDPNRIDSRKVRRELGDRMVNLGRRANRVPSTAKRF